MQGRFMTARLANPGLSRHRFRIPAPALRGSSKTRGEALGGGWRGWACWPGVPYGVYS